jgi:hypothetical protein
MVEIILSIILFYSCEFSKDKYQLIPTRDFEQIVSKVTPSKNVECWEYRNFDCFDESTKIVYSSSKCDSTLASFKPSIEKGFIESCHPLICYDYIVLEINGKLKVIDNKSDAFRFIGKINNIEEALLFMWIYDDSYYYQETGRVETGGYRITSKYVYFILLKEEWSNDSTLIGQYNIVINRKNHEVKVKRLKTFFEEKW